MQTASIQSALRAAKLDGWLFFDHHRRDPLAYRILGLSDDLQPTRRWYYFLPADGEPGKLVHRIETGRLDSLPGSKTEYSSWQELEAELKTLLAGAQPVKFQPQPPPHDDQSVRPLPKIDGVGNLRGRYIRLPNPQRGIA